MDDDTTRAPDNGAKQGAMALTRDQRMGLVRRYQALALQRQDPLAANLGILSADLMGFAHGLAARVQADLARELPDPEGQQSFQRDAELYLKFLRQIDRLAQIERQLSLPVKGKEKSC